MEKEKCLLFYNLSYNYLLSILPENIKENDLEKYFIGDNRNANSLEDVFERLIISAQNYQGMPRFIKFGERKEKIKELLHNYDLNWIANQSVEDLFKVFHDEFKFSIANENIKYNSWYKWSNSIIDGAKYLKGFDSFELFTNYLDVYNSNPKTRVALPLVISTKVSGIGFALACDFVKELGYLNYPKPDVHIMDICTGLNLCESNVMEVFETIVEIAEKSGHTSYELDKILWLICSGKFYLDKDSNNRDIEIKPHKKDYLEYMKLNYR